MIRISIALAALLVLTGCSDDEKATYDRILAQVEGKQLTEADVLKLISEYSSVPEYEQGSLVIEKMIGSSEPSVEPVVVAALEQPSSEVSSEYVAAVVPERVCAQSPWHGHRYSCSGEYIGDVE